MSSISTERSYINKILKALSTVKEGECEINDLSSKTGIKIDYLRYLIEKMRELGYVIVNRKSAILYIADDKLLKLKKLPEEIVYDYLISHSGSLPVKELYYYLDIDHNDIKAAIGKLITLKVASIIKRGDIPYLVIRGEFPVEVRNTVLKLVREKTLRPTQCSNQELSILESLVKRPGLVKKKMVKQYFIKITDKGMKILNEIKMHETPEKPVITTLTPEIIKSGKWKNAVFKEYDVEAPGPRVFGGRVHPMRDLLSEIREIWISMGFIEEWGPLIELSFWNFDALFQPQDHPARDMHDTFYLHKPKYGELPEKTLVNRVKLTHENGWKTGSKGWGYSWSEDYAKSLVLRTHTTSVTVRKVYEYGQKHAKIFAIGKVFRNETVDYKHLAEFYMVDGIVIDPNANLRELFGILETFYKKLGFKKVVFWPSYFPYTEPSVQVCVYIEKLGKYLEMAGAGIFRPEVTIPLGVSWPVLAWGMGIERIFMVRYGINDIRLIYSNNIGFLRSF